MSTDTKTQDGEDRQLPATWEEFQRERKRAASKAFHAGARWADPTLPSCGPRAVIAASDYVRETYPITKRVPREVALVSGKGVARVVGGRVSFQAFDGGHYYDAAVSFLAPEDAKAIADLVARPYDEVAE